MKKQKTMFETKWGYYRSWIVFAFCFLVLPPCGLKHVFFVFMVFMVLGFLVFGFWVFVFLVLWFFLNFGLFNILHF